MILTILYAEDDRVVADAVRELLESEGWRVELCRDGDTAFKRITGGAAFDLLLLDDEMPGASGLEIVRHARGLPRYERTPVVVLSSGAREAEARRAGADLFLRKPEDVGSLIETIRLLID